MPFLIIAEFFIEKFIDGFTTFAPANPNDTGSVQIIDDSSVLMPFAIRDLVYPDTLKASNPVAEASNQK
jgi:hypothetical protein